MPAKQNNKSSLSGSVLEAVFDKSIAALTLFVTAPVIIERAAAIAVRESVKVGKFVSPIFIGTRYGQLDTATGVQTAFKVAQLQTLTSDPTTGNKKPSALGQFLREHGIDKVPLLLNVVLNQQVTDSLLTGQLLQDIRDNRFGQTNIFSAASMQLVGPRPEPHAALNDDMSKVFAGTPGRPGYTGASKIADLNCSEQKDIPPAIQVEEAYRAAYQKIGVPLRAEMYWKDVAMHLTTGRRYHPGPEELARMGSKPAGNNGPSL
jgi:lipopolysaccharide/colanic/teichoic acid biosynthesis glycosyltransferase